jgi:hypothetical protein
MLEVAVLLLRSGVTIRARVKRCCVCAVAACGVLACADQVVLGGPATTTAAAVCDLTIRVTPASATLHVGDTLRGQAHDDCTPSAAFIWKSTRPLVASVDSLSGFITALSAGTTVVTANEVVDPTVGGAITVVVGP